jgi:hypothetical protein
MAFRPRSPVKTNMRLTWSKPTRSTRATNSPMLAMSKPTTSHPLIKGTLAEAPRSTQASIASA